MTRTNNILLLAAALIVIAPLVIPSFSGTFEGSDAQAEKVLK